VKVNSSSALRNKSFSNPEAILTSPNVAPNAVRQEKQNVMEMVVTAMEMVATATEPNAKCSPRFVPSAVRKLKYRSSLVKADQCIAVIATVK